MWALARLYHPKQVDLEEGPTSYEDMLTNMADTLCEAAPDDQHCQVVLVVDYDQIPEASAFNGS